MFAKIGIIAAIPFILLGAFIATTDTAIVDVKDGDTRIIVPVPVTLAKIAMNFVPQDEMTMESPELYQYRDAIDKVLRELDHAPDGEFVRVKDGQSEVVVEKRGRHFHVEVDDDGTMVRAKMPIKAARRFIDRIDDETFNAKDLLDSFSNTTTGNVVHVIDGDTEVKITIW
ncbi:MAG: hypothetical protein HKN21_13975 [Candidatus Eisenbacteria bacterium]|uniref:Uncharacterized protein n=1 Tax=Eiseniibacteriota bacterium TaxID=2212470 RepID=A0A7Y2H3I4_UNCEI|nr:hypothetical protein [Candidatus Eisenbacteria bacterium]